MRWHLIWLFCSALLAFSGCGNGPKKDAECTSGDEKLAGDGCNTCVCSDDGQWSCTKRACGPDACEPGTSKEADDGCNTCYCTDGGSWACTEIACPPADDGCTTDDDCFVGGCGSTVCSNQREVSTTCEERPGDACFRDSGVTSCGCFDGKCGWDQTEELEQCLAAVCVDGETKPAGDGCNTCTCNSGQWLCTLRACEPQCPEPKSYGGSCVDVVVWARGPDGSCCEYPDPCSVPDGWIGFNSEQQCQDYQTGECPAPLPLPEDGGCGAAEVWAKDPDTGICCNYGYGCVAPADWEQYGSPEECEGTAGQCTDGETKDAPDGCNTCTCVDGQWSCTEIACQAGACSDDSDCVVTGCSGQLCAAQQVITTCEFLPHYACYQDADVTTCGCQDGVCGWAQTDELAQCLTAGGPGM